MDAGGRVVVVVVGGSVVVDVDVDVVAGSVLVVNCVAVVEVGAGVVLLIVAVVAGSGSPDVVAEQAATVIARVPKTKILRVARPMSMIFAQRPRCTK